ncbi:MAG: TetR family transcriptional regulator [Bdellovibrionales bacterium]|nr:TetR family transcriptional regulator [Bdellovibrionales bacterium]
MNIHIKRLIEFNQSFDTLKSMNVPHPSKEIGGLDARQRILKTATKLFAERGLHAATTRQIALDAQVNISLISYYFGGKDALYQTALREYAAQIERDVNDTVNMAGGAGLNRETFVKAIMHLLSRVVDGYMENPHMKKILTNEMNSGMPHSLDLFNEVFDRFARKIMSLVQRAKDAGIVKPDVHPLLFVMLMVKSIEGYMMCQDCETKLSKEILKMPRDRDQILHQLRTIYLEGALA